MELRRVIWAWEPLLQRLLARDPELGRTLRRSCRPIAAERRADLSLFLALGCWWPDDLTALQDDVVREHLDAALSELLDDQVESVVVRWPGGLATPEAVGENPDEIEPPDVLADVPPEGRDEAEECESAVQKLFFARTWARGLRLRCQYPVLTYRLDFALPRERIGVEIPGWERPRGRGGEREEQLGASGWRVLRFGASEVLADPDGCVDQLARLLPPTARAERGRRG